MNLPAHERNEVFILLTGIDQYINQKWQDRNFRGSSPDHRSIRVTEVNHCVNEEVITITLSTDGSTYNYPPGGIITL